MLIVQEKDKKPLLSDYCRDNGRGSTYDLRIGAIIQADAGRTVTRFDKNPDARVSVPPQGIVWLVSRECLQLPDNVTCQVDLVNGVSRLGLLAVNTGVIDPNFNGPISTALINFSNVTRDLQINDRFFRVTFFKHAKVQKAPFKIVWEDYIRNLIKESREFPSTFLDIAKIDQNIEKEVGDKISAHIPKVLPIFVFVLSMILLTLSVLSLILSSETARNSISQRIGLSDNQLEQTDGNTENPKPSPSMIKGSEDASVEEPKTKKG